MYIHLAPVPSPPAWRGQWRGACASQPQSLHEAMYSCCRCCEGCSCCRCVWSSFEKQNLPRALCNTPWRCYPLLELPHLALCWWPSCVGSSLGLEMGCTTVTDPPSLVCKQMPLTTTDHLATSMASQARGSYNWKWRKGDQVRPESQMFMPSFLDSQVHVGIWCDTHHPPAPVLA